MQQFQPLRCYLRVRLTHTRDVATRTIKVGDEAELDRLRRENAQLKEDVEILKKATAFFAKHDR